MELFKNTNFDFLGRSGRSSVLAGADGGRADQPGGEGRAEVRNRFQGRRADVSAVQSGAAGRNRSATRLSDKIRGRSRCSRSPAGRKCWWAREIADEKELNANRQIIEDTLRSTFGDPAEEAGSEQLLGGAARRSRCATRCCRPAWPLSEQDCRTWCRRSRTSGPRKGGLLNSLR